MNIEYLMKIPSKENSIYNETPEKQIEKLIRLHLIEFDPFLNSNALISPTRRFSHASRIIECHVRRPFRRIADSITN